MKELQFYDLVKKKYFTSSNYTTTIRKGRKYAIAESPFTGKNFWRIMSNA